MVVDLILVECVFFFLCVKCRLVVRFSWGVVCYVVCLNVVRLLVLGVEVDFVLYLVIVICVIVVGWVGNS